MAYTVTIRIESGPVIEATDYDDLDKALSAAKFSGFGGPHPVEVIVTDADFKEISRQLYNA